VPVDTDVDCERGSGNGPSYVAGPVRVVGDDIYHLDRDGDEARWTKIATSHGPINFMLAWAHKILLSDTASFDVILVDTDLYRNWNGRGADRETAFYQTYMYLLRHVVRRARQITEVLIDDRLDSYDKQHEVVETIGNRMLARLQSTGRLKSVRKASSRETPGIQVADLLTGAFVAAHRVMLDPDSALHPGKRLAAARLAEVLGWPDLCCDTHPHPKFNVWHFPIEFRAIPETRRIVTPDTVRYVDRDELARWLTLV
jgi:hypothetical protein